MIPAIIILILCCAVNADAQNKTSNLRHQIENLQNENTTLKTRLNQFVQGQPGPGADPSATPSNNLSALEASVQKNSNDIESLTSGIKVVSLLALLTVLISGAMTGLYIRDSIRARTRSGQEIEQSDKFNKIGVALENIEHKTGLTLSNLEDIGSSINKVHIPLKAIDTNVMDLLPSLQAALASRSKEPSEKPLSTPQNLSGYYEIQEAVNSVAKDAVDGALRDIGGKIAPLLKEVQSATRIPPKIDYTIPEKLQAQIASLDTQAKQQSQKVEQNANTTKLLISKIETLSERFIALYNQLDSSVSRSVFQPNAATGIRSDATENAATENAQDYVEGRRQPTPSAPYNYGNADFEDESRERMAPTSWENELQRVFETFKAQPAETKSSRSDKETLTAIYEILIEKWATIEERIADDDIANLKTTLSRIDKAIYTDLHPFKKTASQRGNMKIQAETTNRLVMLLIEAQQSRKETLRDWGLERIEADQGTPRQRSSEWAEDTEADTVPPPSSQFANTLYMIRPGKAGYRFKGKALRATEAVYYGSES